jgi:DNA-binding NarL/FixJ family response regulator
MSRTFERDAPESGTGEFEPGIALVGAGRADEGIIAVLEELELEFTAVDGVDALLAGEAEPATVLVRIDQSLARAASRDLERLCRKLPRAAVVVVCEEVRPGELRAALAAGVSGVIFEGQLAATLGSCLEATRSGQVCVPKRHARQVEPAALSAREKQILGLVVMGYMNVEIGEQLFVAESTVKSHLSSAFAKLGVRSRNEAVDLILDPERGLGMGILALGGERVEPKATAR